MLVRVLLILAFLGQVLPPIACARCCWADNICSLETQADENCGCCDHEEDADRDIPARRDGPHAPACPANPERHLVSWSPGNPPVEYDAHLPGLALDVPRRLPVVAGFSCTLLTPSLPVQAALAFPLRC